MKTKLIPMAFGLILLCLFSCASPHQNATQAIQIDSDFPHAKIQYKDSLYDVPAIIIAKKEMPNVPFTVILDTVKKEMKIEEANIARNYWLFGQINDDVISTLNGNYNKFPRNVYIQNVDTTLVTDSYELADLGLRNYRSISLYFGSPIISFFLAPNAKGKESEAIGMIGVSAGVEYIYSWKRGIVFEAKGVSSGIFQLFNLGFPTSAYSFSLCHANTTSVFSFRYGMNYNYYRYQYGDYYATNFNYALSLGATLGFFAKRYFNPVFGFQAGFTFSPSFYQMTPIGNAFKFNYSVLLEIQFMLNVLKWHR